MDDHKHIQAKHYSLIHVSHNSLIQDKCKEWLQSH